MHIKTSKIVVTRPDGTSATYDDYLKIAEDIYAFETGEGRLPQDIIDRFHHMVRSVGWARVFGQEGIVAIFASALGYKLDVRHDIEI